MSAFDCRPASSDLTGDRDRLAALRDYDILDTSPEQGFDDLVEIARSVCQVPIALVSLVSDDRQWFKARIGIEARQTGLDASICSHVLAVPDLLAIPDLTADPRTCENPLVTGAPHLRFYAGVPLRTARGHAIGALCVIDTVVRDAGLTAAQIDVLKRLGRQVMAQMELRRVAAERHADEVRHQQIVESAIDFAIVAMDRDGTISEWSSGAEHILGWGAAEIRGGQADCFFTPEDRSAGRIAKEMSDALAFGRASDERWHLRKSGERFWASGEMMPLRDTLGAHIGYVKVLRDRTTEHLAGEALRLSQSALERAQAAGGVGVFSVSLADDVLWPTPEFCRIYGLPVAARYPARIVEERVIADDRARVSSAGTRGEGGAASETTYRIRHPETGAIRWIARTSDFDRDAAGKPVRFVGVARDVTEVHQAERRRAGLLDLSDRLRDLPSPAHIAFAGAEVLGRTLDVSLVGFGVVEGDAQTVTVDRDWHAAGTDSLAGVTPLRAFGDHADALDRGDTVVVSDTGADASRSVGALEARGARAFVLLPVCEKDRLVALLYIGSRSVRPWSRHELVFVRDVTERLRSAIERARRDAALRESEERFRVFAETVPNHVWSSRPDGYLDWFNRQVYAYGGSSEGRWMARPPGRPSSIPTTCRRRALPGVIRSSPAKTTRRSSASAATTASIAGSWSVHSRCARATAPSRDGSAPTPTSTTRGRRGWPLRRSTRASRRRSPGARRS